MKRPITPFVMALVSLILCPILLVIELSALFFAGMVTYEPSNPLAIKILVVAVPIVIALVTLALPLVALRLGIRARSAARSEGTGGSGLATAAVVISALVTLGVLAAQVYYLLMVFGNCGLDGC